MLLTGAIAMKIQDNRVSSLDTVTPPDLVSSLFCTFRRLFYVRCTSWLLCDLVSSSICQWEASAGKQRAEESIRSVY